MKDMSSTEVSDTELCSPFTASPGGVMTDEIGVITAELELRTCCTPTVQVSVEVRYDKCDRRGEGSEGVDRCTSTRVGMSYLPSRRSRIPHQFWMNFTVR